MKKVLCAMLAMILMAGMFTSCKGDKADPTLEPVAGKAYHYDDPIYPGGYIDLKFHMNYGVTQVILQNTGALKQTDKSCKWKMENGKEISIYFKKGTKMLDPTTMDPVDVGGQEFYHGTYDAASGDLHLKVVFGGVPSGDMVFHEVK